MAQVARVNVLKEILFDLFRHKLVVLLILLNTVTAFSIIQVTHNSRATVIQQDKLMQQRDELEIEWRHLTLEQRTFSEHSRVEDIAKKDLDMYRPDAKDEVIIKE